MMPHFSRSGVKNASFTENSINMRVNGKKCEHPLSWTQFDPNNWPGADDGASSKFSSSSLTLN